VAEKRIIRTDYLARVEGEGAMMVRLENGRVEHVELRIFEPPRFFEALLRGRSFAEAPDITARICGICPVAYQTSAVNALENLSGCCGASCSAASGSRATRYTSTCSTRRTSSATPGLSNWRATRHRRSSAAWR
jgi:hypothetical protein